MMKEQHFLEIIKKTLAQNDYIGDDCAYLKELGIVVTHDSLVEGIHFLTKLSTPYQLGYKAIMVNLSDIFASGASPKYITISLSLPSETQDNFVKEFYKACRDLSQEFGFEIIGGDITGGEKIFVSICAIGITQGRRISSRSYAQEGDYVVVTGEHGSSAAGLFLLQNKAFAISDKISDKLINTHLMPVAQKEFSEEISTKADRAYAMMDTSDGIADALFKIAQASNVSISVDFDKIPYDKNIEQICKKSNVDLENLVLYGGEDYQLVACIDENNLKKIKSDYTIIGKVEKANENYSAIVNFNNGQKRIIDLKNTYNHFESNQKRKK